MNDSTQQALRRALDAAALDEREAANDFEAIVDKARAPRHGRMSVAIAAAALLALALSGRDSVPTVQRQASSWMVVQVDVDDRRTDLRVRVHRPIPSQPKQPE